MNNDYCLTNTVGTLYVMSVLFDMTRLMFNQCVLEIFLICFVCIYSDIPEYHGQMTNTDNMEDSDRLTSYLSLAIAALGIFGNLVCARMMLVSPMKQYSTSYLIFGTVISDTIAVVIESLDNLSTFLPDISEDEILNGTDQWRCRFGRFFWEMSRLVSSWLVVAMSVELFLAKRGPESMQSVYNQRRAIYVTLAVYLTSFAACFPLLVIGKASSNMKCTSKYPVFYDLYTALVLPVAVDYIVPIIFITYCAACCLRTTDFAHPFVVQKQEKAGPPLQFRTLITVTSLVFVFVSLPHYVLSLMLSIEQHQMSTLPDSLRYSTSGEVRLAHNIADTLLLLHYSSKFYLAYLLEEDCRASFHRIFKFARVKTQSHTSPMSRESDAAYFDNTRHDNY